MKNTKELIDLRKKNSEENRKTVIEMKTISERTRIIINLTKTGVNDKGFRKWESNNR